MKRLSVAIIERARKVIDSGATDDDAQYLAELALDYARHLDEHTKIVDAFTQCEERYREVLEQRRMLARVIEKIAASDPDSRDRAVAEALIAARASQ
jgi:hypothetical protein